MKKKILAIAIILVVLVLVGISAQGDYGKAIRDWKGLSLDKLDAKGASFLDKGNIDSALICYTMVMNNYKPDMDSYHKDVCCRAFNNAGYLFFYYRNDYSSSYSCLLKALDIAEESGNAGILPCIYLNMGNIYINYNDTHASDSLYRKAFHASVKAHDYEIMITTLSNLTISAMSRNETQSVAEEIAVFRHQQVPKREMRAYINVPGREWWQTEFTLKDGTDVFFRETMNIEKDWATNAGANYSVSASAGQKLYVNFETGKGSVK